MRFMKPYRGLIAVTLLVLLIDNVGTLLVPTMLANMVNTGITTGDVDYILRNGFYMLIDLLYSYNVQTIFLLFLV